MIHTDKTSYKVVEICLLGSWSFSLLTIRQLSPSRSRNAVDCSPSKDSWQSQLWYMIFENTRQQMTVLTKVKVTLASNISSCMLHFDLVALTTHYSKTYRKATGTK